MSISQNAASRADWGPCWARHYPAGVDWRLDIPTRPVDALLDDSVARFPAHPFLDFLGKRRSYAATAALVAKAALGL